MTLGSGGEGEVVVRIILGRGMVLLLICKERLFRTFLGWCNSGLLFLGRSDRHSCEVEGAAVVRPDRQMLSYFVLVEKDRGGWH
jgi:hypothetical protein